MNMEKLIGNSQWPTVESQDVPESNQILVVTFTIRKSLPELLDLPLLVTSFVHAVNEPPYLAALDSNLHTQPDYM